MSSLPKIGCFTWLAVTPPALRTYGIIAFVHESVKIPIDFPLIFLTLIVLPGFATRPQLLFWE